MEYKKFFYKSIISIVSILFVVALTVIIVDPQFHYHKPLSGLEYKLTSERYQNYGIAKHFDYNAIITGSSMTVQFKTSEMDALFGTKSIKAPFSGASFKESSNYIKTAIKNNDEINMIIRSMDNEILLNDKDSMSYSNYPEYLFDENYLNDVNYILNNSTFFEYLLINTIRYTLKGNKTTDFDSFMHWGNKYPYGKKFILQRYDKPEQQKPQGALTLDEKEMIEENMEQNIISLARENPQIQFYYFLTPYNVLYYDKQNRLGMLQKQLEAEKYASGLLLDQKNIQVFSFANKYDIVSNLDIYNDDRHYSEDINTKILEFIHKGEGRLTRENHENFFSETMNYYLNYDYESIFQSE